MMISEQIGFVNLSDNIQQPINFLEERTDLSTVVRMYNQRDFGYHNLNHIEELLHELSYWQNTLPKNDVYKLNRDDLAALVYIIIFHDVIYYPGYCDNEHDSSMIAKIHLQEAGIHEKQIRVVCNVIEDSSHHFPQGDLSDEGKLRFLLGKIMFDLDFSPIGKNQKIYFENSQKLSREFLTRFSKEEFENGRINFLNHMLEKDKIFNLKYFENHYERSSRNNINKELQQLLVKKRA